jgi:GNAT superfamily N-acetyltransferase
MRKQALWAERGRAGEYDRRHAGELAPGHHPLLLTKAGWPIGVVRVDSDGEVAYLRRVAVAAEWRGPGYGRALVLEAKAFARVRGAVVARSKVAADAVGFYLRLGFTRDGLSLPDGGVPMLKPLGEGRSGT